MLDIGIPRTDSIGSDRIGWVPDDRAVRLMNQVREGFEQRFVGARGAVGAEGLDADLVRAGVEMGLDVGGDLLGRRPSRRARRRSRHCRRLRSRRREAELLQVVLVVGQSEVDLQVRPRDRPRLRRVGLGEHHLLGAEQRVRAHHAARALRVFGRARCRDGRPGPPSPRARASCRAGRRSRSVRRSHGCLRHVERLVHRLEVVAHRRERLLVGVASLIFETRCAMGDAEARG